MHSYNRLYTLLNVLPDADLVVIEAAYRALIKKYHPDKHGPAEEEAEGRAAELNHAFAVLRNPERRAAYDAEETERRERNRVELARINHKPPASTASEDSRRAAAPARPDSSRAEQRLAAWVGVLGVAFLTAALFLFARGLPQVEVGASPSTLTAASEIAPAPLRPSSPDDDELAFSNLPVNRRTVTDAVAQFRQISARGGLNAAADFSERCFESQRRTRGISDFDYCIAFDHAASRAELVPGTNGQEKSTHFQPVALITRHVGAADRLSGDKTLIEARLFEIRQSADAALMDFAGPRPLGQMVPGTAPAPIAAPARSKARVVTRVPSRSSPRGERRRSEDFLERQGGIY